MIVPIFNTGAVLAKWNALGFKGSLGAFLVQQNDLGNRYAGTTIIAAITGRVKELPTLVNVEPSEENGLRRPCAINLSHLRTVSQRRLVARLARIEEKHLPQIEQATLISLGFR